MHWSGSCPRATQLVIVSQYRCLPHLDIRTPRYAKTSALTQISCRSPRATEFKNSGSVSTATPLCLRPEMLTVPSNLSVLYNVSFNSSPKGIPNRTCVLRHARAGVTSSTTSKVGSCFMTQYARPSISLTADDTGTPGPMYADNAEALHPVTFILCRRRGFERLIMSSKKTKQKRVPHCFSARPCFMLVGGVRGP